MERRRIENDRTASCLLPPSLIPHGQPPRPNTAVQYPVFNPELPRLQSSPSPLHAQSWSNLLRHYPGDLGSTLPGILTYGVQIGYRGKKHFCHSTNHYIQEPSIITGKLAEDLNLCRIRLASEPSLFRRLGYSPSTMGDGAASMTYPDPLDEALTRVYQTTGQPSST